MRDYEQLMKRQQVLADFGEFTLHNQNLDAVLNEACRLVGDALGTGRAKVLEIQNQGRSLFVRAGVGWDPAVVGHMHLPMSERSSETFAINEGKPVISQDISKEERFEVPEFMKQAGVKALVNVPIRFPGGKAYGLLQVDATEPRDFGHQDTEFLRTYAIILGPVIDRLQKLSTLRATEERFRLVVENARDYAIFTSDREDRVTDWYPGAETVFGWSPEEVIGQPAAIIFTPEDREKGEDAHETEMAAREGSAPNVRWHVRKDGSRVFIEGTTTSLRAANGSLRGFLKIGQDVTKRRYADQALRESEELRRIALESGEMGAWRWNTRDWSVRADDVVQKLWGISTSEQPHSVSVYADLMTPEGVAWLEAAMAKGLGPGEEFHGRLKVARGPAAGRWIQLRGRAERERPWIINGVSFDITEEKTAATRQEVLVNELQHRARNLLGVITAVADRTVKRGGSVEAFEERLKALSRAQGLLSKGGSDTVEVGALLRAELAAYEDEAGGRVTVVGPEVLLRAPQVQNFALAVHELTTNAVKYGALKVETGRLAASWEIVLDKRGRYRLALSWIESGVAIEPENVARRGFGTELIQEALAYALEAEVDYVMGADGVRCRIEMPLS
ncbi:PAS domain S-box protein [Methylorubrum sp. DB1722]|uniref:PAS domain S-box protein n=1 Tax=Methylorubrum sp. DB1722 TaxID=2478916 RepID=UPI0018E2A8A1|nr:PAS domain S-box protein [Methylorubrum sp. DB1722]MBI1692060.1 PAS domain S-box protein [Methylorubrum sp. DB1722]